MKKRHGLFLLGIASVFCTLGTLNSCKKKKPQPSPAPAPAPAPSPIVGKSQLEIQGSSSIVLVDRTIATCESNINTITIKNIGEFNISNITVQIPDPLQSAGVTSTNNCGSALAPNQTCTITFIPDNQKATTTIVSISGQNTDGTDTDPIQANVTVLGYSTSALDEPSIYQEGYVYHLVCTNDVFSEGRVAALTNQSGTYTWSTSGNDGTCASNLYDGFTNTACLTDVKFQAAYTCINYNSGTYDDWYLPAICEMGPNSNGSGCTAGTPIA